MTQKITIMDGGMGRLLKDMGAPFRRPEWSALALMEAPEFVTKAHEAYIEARAEIIITNSYAVIPFHIGEDAFNKQGRELIKLSAKIARECANHASINVKVAGCIPPAFGSYRADLYVEEKAGDIYLPHIEEQDEFVDFWLAETISTVREAEKIASLLKNNTKPLWLSYTVKDRESVEEKPQLRSGETIEEAILTSIDLGASALLFNCSQPEEIEPVLDIVKNHTLPMPYGAYANAFEPIKRDQQANAEETTVRKDTTPENYLTFSQKWVDQGATIIGGCCGIGPEHIKKLNDLNK